MDTPDRCTPEANVPTGRPSLAGMLTDLEAAWNELHDATPAGWRVGRPSCNDRRG